MLEIVVDGGCRGNGGLDPQMYGSAHFSMVVDGSGTKGKLVTWEFGPGTSNMAEYRALIAALETLGDNFRYDCLTIKMDSAMVINQVLERWKITREHPEYRPLRNRVQDLLLNHSSWQFVQISHDEMKRILGH